MRRHAVVVIALIALYSCAAGHETIWSQDLLSPDGSWIASASTIENAGAGTDGIGTFVTLRPVRGSGKEVDVAEFAHDSGSEKKLIDLSMHWLSKNRLDMTYDNNPEVEYYLCKYQDVTISIRPAPMKGR